MRINGIKVETEVNSFAYDGCHKIYILEDFTDLSEAQQECYTIYHIQDLERVYDRSCPLKFINNWKLDKCYAEQGEEAIFDEDDDCDPFGIVTFDDYETMEILEDDED